MTIEGARRETAEEMGKVLRFPERVRRTGGAAQSKPWNTTLIHTGMSELNRQFSSPSLDSTATRAKVAELRKEHELIKANITKLQFGQNREEFHAERKKELDVIARLNAELAKLAQIEVRQANALWAEKTFPFDPNYTKSISKHYETGGVFSVDFKNNFEAERLKINGWVEQQTNDRIKELLPIGELDQNSRLVLTNAIYFKGDWASPFNQKLTKDRDFILAGGAKQQTAIMHAPYLVARYGAFNADGSYFATPRIIGGYKAPKNFYPESDGFAVAELPYKGNELSMVVIAPNDASKLSAIEQKLSSDNVNKWLTKLKKRSINVYLPKFKMETDYTLGDENACGPLQKMGMVRAFTEPKNYQNGAQFGGMIKSGSKCSQLYISKVLHKAFLEVSEEGTEAAAATAVILKQAIPVSARTRISSFIPDFKADRPFIYLIRDTKTGSILFIGRMMNPAG